MAIAFGQSTQTFTVERRTWHFQIASPKGAIPSIEVYREECETAEDGTFRTTPNHTPIRLNIQDLAGLAEYLDIPQLKELIPDVAAAAKILAIMPLLIAGACDAADRKNLAEQAHAEAELNQAPL